MLPAASPGAAPSRHQPVRLMAAGTASSPLRRLSATGLTGASTDRSAIRRRVGRDAATWASRAASTKSPLPVFTAGAASEVSETSPQAVAVGCTTDDPAILSRWV